LANDVTLLSALGEVVTIQIDLVNAEHIGEIMRQEFNDSEEQGLYIDNMILQRILDHHNHNYVEIFDKIAELTGEYEAIEGVTALIRLKYDNEPIEVTVQLLGGKPPQLMQVTDQEHYFQLVQLIQARWQFARSRMM
jgi:hypothetical protein